MERKGHQEDKAYENKKTQLLTRPTRGQIAAQHACQLPQTRTEAQARPTRQRQSTHHVG
jgi:hypothetical protein